MDSITIAFTGKGYTAYGRQGDHLVLGFGANRVAALLMVLRSVLA